MKAGNIMAVLTFLTGLFAWLWIRNDIAVKALALYMVGKGYTPPTAEEGKACTIEVLRRTFSKRS